MQAIVKLVAALVVIAVSASVHAGAPPKEIVDKLKRVIREHSPDAIISVTKEQGFVAKQGTMQFLIHDMSSFGEFLPTTHFEEGPNFKGFLLQLRAISGKAEVAAKSPQTLERQYYPTYLDAPLTDDGETRYLVSFAYGSRLDPKLKKAIFETIPRTRAKNEKTPVDADGLPADRSEAGSGKE